MPKLPVVRGRELIRALERDGWYIVDTTGHHRMRHPQHPGFIVVPNHPGKVIPPDTLRSILKMPGITSERLRDLL